MKLIRCILTENDCYQTKRTIKPRGVMVHSTGADNPTLRRYVQPVKGGDGDYAALMAQLGVNKNGNHWNRPGLDVCVHGFIGKLADGSIASAQTLPWTHRGWHAGTGTSGGSANNTHISFEICEDDLTDPAYFKLVYREAVELTAHLCKIYGLDPLGDFRRDVAAELAPKPEPEPEPKPDEEDDEMNYYKTLDEVPEYYRPTVEKLVEAGALKGTAEGVLNVSEEFCRTMTVLDRLGKLD